MRRRLHMPAGVAFTTAAVAATLGLPAVSWAGYVISTGSSFNGTLTQLNVTMYQPKALAKSPNTAFAVTFYTPAGLAAGTVNVTTDGNGLFKIPAASIPAGAAVSGGYVNIVGDGYAAGAPLKIGWSTGFLYFLGLSNGFDPTGLPGTTSPQTWTFVNPSSSTATLVPGGSIPSTNNTLVGSEFDLAYTLVSTGNYTAAITGSNKYLSLQNTDPTVGTAEPEMMFPAGTPFGSLAYTTSTTGTFNFTALGIAGTWSYDAGSNFTTGTITSETNFSAPTIAGVDTVPEPTAVTMVGTGMAGLLVGPARRHRRRAAR